MDENLEIALDRRRCLRQIVHAPAYASFDGVTGGMILDLSEEGLSMQTGGHFVEHRTGTSTAQPLQKGQRVRLDLDFSEPSAHLETTGYIAWADALGRAGVRFSDLPAEARRRLSEWLTVNAGTPSRTAPKVAVSRNWAWGGSQGANGEHLSISLEAGTESQGSRSCDERPASATMQYEFASLGTDLGAALLLIAKRARSLTRGTSAAIALAHKDAVICRASIGEGAPGLGSRLDVNSGISGECFRAGKAVRCDDAEHDARVDRESCRRLGVRSILAAPVRYERDTVGLLMVLAAEPFNFDEGDLAVAESLAHTVVLSMRQSESLRRGA